MPTPTKGPRLGGSPAHQRLMLANLATSLFEHGRITTTEAKAKRLRPLAEKLVTFAKRGDLHARRQVMTTIRDKDVVHTLFAEIGPRFANRPGGYTRITKVGPRKGDNAPMAVIELVREKTVTSEANRARRAASSQKVAAAAAPQGMGYETVRKMLEGRETEEVALDGMRRTIAARLSEAKQTIPHFYLRRSAKLDALMEFRGTLNSQLGGRGVKLSVNDFIIKACALALQEVPDANAVWAGDRILKLKPSDVAVAVAIEGGLFTPVLKDADKKTLSALSTEMKDLAARAKTRKLAPHEYQGGSFAISNLGMFGIENFDAVINPPHGAILAVGAGIQTPVVENGEVVVRNVMSMTLSVDHRVIDGALGAQLLEAIVNHLENPIGMLA